MATVSKHPEEGACQHTSHEKETMAAGQKNNLASGSQRRLTAAGMQTGGVSWRMSGGTLEESVRGRSSSSSSSSAGPYWHRIVFQLLSSLC